MIDVNPREKQTSPSLRRYDRTTAVLSRPASSRNFCRNDTEPTRKLRSDLSQVAVFKQNERH